MKYKILGWNLGVSDDPAHPMKRYTAKFPFETYSINGYDKHVKIPECRHKNDFRSEGSFETVLNIHWLRWERIDDDEVAEPKGSNQITDLKKYLKERTDEIELDLLAIRHTGCGEGAIKGQRGKLEAYQDILNYLTK